MSSSVASPSHCLAKSAEDCKSAIPEWSSPVSVLEPLFIEDDISPPKMRSQSGMLKNMIPSHPSTTELGF